MGKIYITINAYKSPLTAAQKSARNACVAFFTAASGSKLLNGTQKASTNIAIKNLNAKK